VVVELAVSPFAVRLVPSPKAGGTRWLTELDPTLTARYAALVAPAVPTVETRLLPAVMANRVARALVAPPRIELEPWAAARTRFEAAAAALAASARGVLLTDVRDCYGSITPHVAARALRWMGVGAGPTAGIEGFLRNLSGAGVRGLPIGPAPSAVLANAVLADVDRALVGAGFRHLRWVDDLLVFLEASADAARALRVVSNALRSLGLEVAVEKTRTVVDPATLGRAASVVSGPRPEAAVG
jgi:hypothetical protein